MGFVFRKMTNDDLARVRDRIVGPVVQLQYDVAVDDANDIFFIDLGATTLARDTEAMSYFNLIWGGHTVAFTADPRFEGERGAYVLRVDMEHVRIPQALDVDPEMLRQTIEAALTAYRKGIGSGRYSYTVAVTLPATIKRT